MILSFKEEEKREDGGNHFSTGMEQRGRDGGLEPSVTEGRGADRSEAFKHPGCRLPASCSSAAVARIVFNYCCSERAQLQKSRPGAYSINRWKQPTSAVALWKTENLCNADLQTARFSLEGESKRMPSDMRISAEVSCLLHKPTKARLALANCF